MHLTKSMPQVLLVLTLVSCSIGENFKPTAILLIIEPLTAVNGAITVLVDALAVCFSIFEGAGVSISI